MCGTHRICFSPRRYLERKAHLQTVVHYHWHQSREY